MLSSLTTLLKKPLYRFLLAALLFYIAWYCIYELWLHPVDRFDVWVISKTTGSAAHILRWMGFSIFTKSARLVGIDGTPGLWMGDNCDSIELWAIFTGFILAFPGRWKHKLWYIPMGIVLIFALNVLRVVGLAIVQKNVSEKWLEFNHTYTFTIIVYAFIFGLWLIWVNKIAGKKLFKSKEAHE
jgi:exosortase/archaeosortase family protein